MIKKKLHYNNEIHKDLPALEQNHFWFKARNEIIEYILKKFFKKKAIYLEIGCGTGYVLKMLAKKLPNFKITGSELFDTGLKQAKKRLKKFKKIKLIKLDACNLRVKNKYDIIGAFDVIEHIKEEDLIFNNINTALKKDGLFIFTVPQHEFLWSINDELGFHQRRYTRKYLLKKLNINGFKIVYVNSFNSLLMPLMYLSRKFNNNYEKKNFDVLSELKINSLLNTILFFILKFEIFLIKIGLNFKFGGSLIGVAIKR